MRKLLLSLLLLPGPLSAAPFYAAAGKADITPDLEKETVWLAGFGAKGRRPEGVHDPLYARAVVVSDGKRTAALVAVDLLGLYRADVEEIRRSLGWTGGDRSLFLVATHTHSGPDTLGLWGRWLGVSGVDRRYQRRVRETVAALVRDLASRMQEADLAYARADLDPRGLSRDLRDPVVIDPELAALSLRDRKGKAIGSLVRWSCHPEALGRENRQVSADFPGALCARIEEATGGACVFLPGAVGGLLSPDTEEGLSVAGEYAAMERIGRRLADEALRALRGAPRRAGGEVSFASRTVRIPVENSRYLAFLPSLAFGHELQNRDGHALGAWRRWWLPLRHVLFYPLRSDLRPWIETEVSLLRIGRIAVLGLPGELFPELALGGYGGEFRFGHPLVGPSNPNPPDLKKAPAGPYLRALLGKEGLLVGLANDEIGYIVPEYDFQTAPTRTMLPRPPGTHYEETNSIGRSAAPLLLDAARELLSSSPLPR
ncbi:MAG TPA: hypothetical protein DD417_06325 [Elusimicrobia bacterium]|nr:hypothetical protein [Elusimicrobiota bacterium]